MGRVFGRGLEQAGEHRGLRDGHVLDGFAKIELRRRLHAESSPAHVDAVKVELQDVPFRQVVLEPEGEKGFIDFARDRALVGEKQVLGELLRNRGAALHHAGGLCVHRQRARRSDYVDAKVLIKPSVFRREDSLDQMGRILLQRHGVVMSDAAVADLGPIAIEKCDGEVGALEPVVLARQAKRRKGEGQSDKSDGETQRQCLT